MTNGNGRAWQVLRDLPSWQVTRIPRRPDASPGQPAGLFARMPGWMQLAGVTASQLETVQPWLDTDQRDQQELRAVGYGTRPVSAIEQAVGARAADSDREPCLAGALIAFQDCSWPLDLPRPAGT